MALSSNHAPCLIHHHAKGQIQPCSNLIEHPVVLISTCVSSDLLPSSLSSCRSTSFRVSSFNHTYQKQQRSHVNFPRTLSSFHQSSSIQPHQRLQNAILVACESKQFYVLNGKTKDFATLKAQTSLSLSNLYHFQCLYNPFHSFSSILSFFLLVLLFFPLYNQLATLS